SEDSTNYHLDLDTSAAPSHDRRQHYHHPDDESPSLGHQSEDDGYMSMNGRKAKFSLSFKPLAEHHEPPMMRPGDPDDFPPPPEEAQRLIATLLPK
ncbi:hypothetical protein JTB14_031976, partial [Gonioctena quinquepunctata]